MSLLSLSIIWRHTVGSPRIKVVSRQLNLLNRSLSLGTLCHLLIARNLLGSLIIASGLIEVAKGIGRVLVNLFLDSLNVLSDQLILDVASAEDVVVEWITHLGRVNADFVAWNEFFQTFTELRELVASITFFWAVFVIRTE